MEGHSGVIVFNFLNSDDINNRFKRKSTHLISGFPGMVELILSSRKTYKMKVAVIQLSKYAKIFHHV